LPHLALVKSGVEDATEESTRKASCTPRSAHPPVASRALSAQQPTAKLSARSTDRPASGTLEAVHLQAEPGEPGRDRVLASGLAGARPNLLLFVAEQELRILGAARDELAHELDQVVAAPLEGGADLARGLHQKNVCTMTGVGRSPPRTLQICARTFSGVTPFAGGKPL
jgi:hypothetical protein